MSTRKDAVHRFYAPLGGSLDPARRVGWECEGFQQLRFEALLEAAMPMSPSSSVLDLSLIHI